MSAATLLDYSFAQQCALPLAVDPDEEDERLILVTGPRVLTDFALVLGAVFNALADCGQATIVQGGAEGADELARRAAVDLGAQWRTVSADWTGPCKRECPPGHRRRRRDWRPGEPTTYCPWAGFRRNQAMVDLRPVLCVAFLVPGAKCSGTRDCARRAEAARVPVRWVRQRLSARVV